MMNIQRLLILTVLLMAIFTPAVLSQKPKADLIVRNAVVYTMDSARSWAQSIAVKDGRLVFIGNDGEIKRWIGNKTKVVDAGGRLILPGFHDTHVHLALAASRQHWCDIGYPKTLEATREAITNCIRQSAGRPWVLVTNPNTTVFPPNGPELSFLEAV